MFQHRYTILHDDDLRCNGSIGVWVRAEIMGHPTSEPGPPCGQTGPPQASANNASAAGRLQAPATATRPQLIASPTPGRHSKVAVARACCLRAALRCLQRLWSPHLKARCPAPRVGIGLPTTPPLPSKPRKPLPNLFGEVAASAVHERSEGHPRKPLPSHLPKELKRLHRVQHDRQRNDHQNHGTHMPQPGDGEPSADEFHPLADLVCRLAIDPPGE